jgi:hypothetical protein
MYALTRNFSAAEINNSAVTCIQAGRTQEAMEILQIALSDLRDQFVATQDPVGKDSPQEPVAHDDHDQHMDINVEQEEFSKPSDSIYVFSGQPVALQEDVSLLTLYDRALLVDTIYPCQDKEILSAVILFNMALLHHFRGLEEGKTEFLHSANRFYHFALSILQKPKTLKPNYLLLMALFNNMAHVDSHLFRMKEMKVSLKRMRTILTAYDDDVPLEDADYAIFFINAVFGEEKEFTVAAAA